MHEVKGFSISRWHSILPPFARRLLDGHAFTPVEEDQPAVTVAEDGLSPAPPPAPPPAPLRRRPPRNRWSLGEIFSMIGFAVTTACVALISAGAHQGVTSLLSSVDSIAQTRQVIEKIELLHSDLKDVESSARSFAISAKQSHLDPYYLASKSATQNMDDLKRTTQGNPRLFKQVSELEPLVARHLGIMKDMVDLGNKHVFRAIGQTTLTDQGHAVMSDIRGRIEQMVDDERHVLSEQEKAATARGWAVRYTVFTACVVAVALGVVVTGGLHRALLARHRTEAKVGGLLEATDEALVIISADGRIVTVNSYVDRYFGYQRQELLGQSIAILLPERFRNQQMKHYADCFSNPDDPTAPRSMELFALRKDGSEFPVEMTIKPLETGDGLVVSSAIHDISLQRRAEEEIVRLNRELDRRSTQFEATSKELEAFSYSVSHDLRAPLRSIDGFSQVLLEDYSPRLDAEGKDCLHRVRAGCQHMGEIIDALLQLSRMTRIEMHRTTVDLSAMAWEIANELKKREPHRQAEFVIAEGLPGDGDERLLRVVLENLLGNAWKFTAKKPAARIEFGTLPQDNGQRVYFVRDDGAGFDMEHAGKLFNAFKRLHDAGDFPGTGIGLTTVQRVVRRHGGKIWAEGAVGKGATFCFTLS